MKTGFLGQLFSSSLHPVFTLPPPAPSLTATLLYPNLLLITEKNVEKSEARSLNK